MSPRDAYDRVTRPTVSHRVARILVMAGAMALFAGEYYVWREHAADPGGLVFLAAMYIGLAITLESLTARLAWSPRSIALFGIVVGTVLEGFFARSFMADEPRVFGINPITVGVMWIYWGVLTAVFARYAADRMIPRMSYRAPRGRWGLFALATWWAVLLFVWGANLGPLPDSGVPATVLLGMLATGLLVWSTRTPDARSPWPRHPWIDTTIVAYLVIEVLAGTLVGDSAARIGIWIIVGLVIGSVGSWVLLRHRRADAAMQAS